MSEHEEKRGTSLAPTQIGERWHWAWKATPIIPDKSAIAPWFITNTVLFVILWRWGSWDTVWEYAVTLLVTLGVSGLLVPAFRLGLNWIRAPHAVIAERLASAEIRREELEKEHDALLTELAQTARPRATASMERSNGDFVVRVRNDGPTASFHANMRVLGASVFPSGVGESHPLLWERARALEAKIVTGGDDYLRVAKVDYRGPVLGTDISLSLYRYDARFAGVQSFWNVGWTGDKQTEEPIAHFELTITAEPEMEGGPIRERFQLGPWTLLTEGQEGYSPPDHG